MQENSHDPQTTPAEPRSRGNLGYSYGKEEYQATVDQILSTFKFTD